MTTLGPYTVHPAAEIFPLITGEEFDELVFDIRHNGLYEPITLTADGSVIVDGRNRYRACDEAMVDPHFTRLPESFSETQILDFIVSHNTRRRHMSPGQLGMAGARLEPMYAAAAKQRQGQRNDLNGSSGAIAPEVNRARSQAAKAVGASADAVKKAKTVIRDAPDLAPKVDSGGIAIDAAYKQARQRAKERERDLPKPDPAPIPKKHPAEPILLDLRTHAGEVVKYPRPVSKPSFNETTGPGISWAAWSWNPVTGCLHGCDYCYAREIATNERFKAAYPVGFTPLFHHERLDAPANTTIPAARRDDPAYKRVFVCSMADLYGRWVPQDWIEQVHASMLASPEWQYITLTKFPDRYPGLEMPPGAWVGTSVDEQKRVRIAQRAFEKLPEGIVKWLSLEPLLEPLQFDDLSMFDWVVIGAQTGTNQPGKGYVPPFAPPIEWVARLIVQAKDAGCKLHLKPNLRSGPGMEWLNEYP